MDISRHLTTVNNRVQGLNFPVMEIAEDITEEMTAFSLSDAHLALKRIEAGTQTQPSPNLQLLTMEQLAQLKKAIGDYNAKGWYVRAAIVRRFIALQLYQRISTVNPIPGTPTLNEMFLEVVPKNREGDARLRIDPRSEQGLLTGTPTVIQNFIINELQSTAQIFAENGYHLLSARAYRELYEIQGKLTRLKPSIRWFRNALDQYDKERDALGAKIAMPTISFEGNFPAQLTEDPVPLTEADVLMEKLEFWGNWRDETEDRVLERGYVEAARLYSEAAAGELDNKKQIILDAKEAAAYEKAVEAVLKRSLAYSKDPEKKYRAFFDADTYMARMQLIYGGLKNMDPSYLVHYTKCLGNKLTLWTMEGLPPERAILTIRKIVRIQEEENLMVPAGYLYLAERLAKNGLPEDASKYFRQFLDNADMGDEKTRDAATEAIDLIASAYRNLDRFQEALDTYALYKRFLLDHAPGVFDSKITEIMAEKAAAEGDKALAIKLYTKLAADAATKPLENARAKVGYIRSAVTLSLEDRNLEGAIVLVTNLLEGFPRGSAAISEAYDLYGLIGDAIVGNGQAPLSNDDAQLAGVLYNQVLKCPRRPASSPYSTSILYEKLAQLMPDPYDRASALFFAAKVATGERRKALLMAGLRLFASDEGMLAIWRERPIFQGKSPQEILELLFAAVVDSPKATTLAELIQHVTGEAPKFKDWHLSDPFAGDYKDERTRKLFESLPGGLKEKGK